MIKTIARYYKALIGSVIAGLTALGTAAADGQVTKEEWIGIALAVLATPLGVGIVTNRPLAPIVANSSMPETTSASAEHHSVVQGILPPARTELHADATPDPPASA